MNTFAVSGPSTPASSQSLSVNDVPSTPGVKPVASGAGFATDADGRVAGWSTGALDRGLVVLGFGDADRLRRDPGMP
eukprot:95118-Pyramimonas_sp.AAC.1